jgi:lipopolysaccharide/colanic/teichoic acid biosynthesis glycosyltransferase
MKRELQLIAKRIMDVVIAITGVIIFAPLLLVSAIAIRLDSRGPVFFRLRVAGLRGQGFDQWKLRTMVEGARAHGDRFETSLDDPRITRVGHVLRRWSIDELPQLWNVVRGEMSIVGPRPAFFEIASKYSAEQARRLAMRPGLTGLAQVRGRNLLTWAKRMELDIFYVERYSVWLDCEIIARTIPVLFQGEGVYGKDGRVRVQDLG